MGTLVDSLDRGSTLKETEPLIGDGTFSSNRLEEVKNTAYLRLHLDNSCNCSATNLLK